MKDQQFSGTVQLLKTIQMKSETFQNHNRTTTWTDPQYSQSCFDGQLHGDSSWLFPLWTKLRKQLQHAGHRETWTPSPDTRYGHQTETGPGLPVDTVYTVLEAHQEPLPYRKLQVFCVCDDQHVGAGQHRAEVIQVDVGVIRHHPNADIGQSGTVLPTGRSSGDRRAATATERAGEEQEVPGSVSYLSAEPSRLSNCCVKNSKCPPLSAGLDTSKARIRAAGSPWTEVNGHHEHSCAVSLDANDESQIPMEGFKESGNVGNSAELHVKCYRIPRFE